MPFLEGAATFNSPNTQVEGRGALGGWFQTAMFYLVCQRLPQQSFGFNLKIANVQVFGAVAQEALETVPSVN